MAVELFALGSEHWEEDKADDLGRCIIIQTGLRAAVVGDFIVVVEDYPIVGSYDYTVKIYPKMEINPLGKPVDALNTEKEQ